MAVQAENFDRSQLSLLGIPPEMVQKVSRQTDGVWVMFLKMDAEAVLPDGRRILFNRHSSVRYTEQLGRRVAAPRKDSHDEGTEEQAGDQDRQGSSSQGVPVGSDA